LYGIYLLTDKFPDRRREVTLQRKKAAEERRRLEEEKAKVRVTACHALVNADLVTLDGTKKSGKITAESRQE
jgi:hypothetical protein